MAIGLWFSMLAVLGPVEEARATRPDLNRLVERFHADSGIPGMAVAVLRPGEGVVDRSVVGVRRRDHDEPVELGDLFKLGSITKPMTATLAARLVEQGRLRFSTTIAQTFPELDGVIRPEYLPVTLEQLLSHSAGVAGDMLSFDHSGPIARLMESLEGDGRSQRLTVLRELLSMEPAAPPGTPGPYSNHGYAIAAAMLERVTDTSFERLIRKEVFRPLGMKHTFIGRWSDRPKRHAGLAVGHRMGSGQPIDPEDREWYPATAALNPAGQNTFTTLDDLCRFVSLHLDGMSGTDGLLEAATVRELHTIAIEGDRRGMGWIIEQGPPVNYHGHTGSDGTYFGIVTIYPQDRMATVILTNVGLLPEQLGPLLVDIYKAYREPSGGTP